MWPTMWTSLLSNTWWDESFSHISIRYWEDCGPLTLTSTCGKSDLCFLPGAVQSGVQHWFWIRDQSKMVRHQRYGISLFLNVNIKNTHRYLAMWTYCISSNCLHPVLYWGNLPLDVSMNTRLIEIPQKLTPSSWHQMYTHLPMSTALSLVISVTSFWRETYWIGSSRL